MRKASPTCSFGMVWFKFWHKIEECGIVKALWNCHGTLRFIAQGIQLSVKNICVTTSVAIIICIYVVGNGCVWRRDAINWSTPPCKHHYITYNCRTLIFVGKYFPYLLCLLHNVVLFLFHTFATYLKYLWVSISLRVYIHNVIHKMLILFFQLVGEKKNYFLSYGLLVYQRIRWSLLGQPNVSLGCPHCVTLKLFIFQNFSL